MFINTNISSLVTRNYITKNSDLLEKSMRNLSSGKRINSAADDAAGLSIATRMTTTIRGIDVASRNANDGISLIQTAESALGSISDILQRMRELAVQADNDTYSSSDKKSLKLEMDNLIQEIDHISNNLQFNGISLLDGSQSSVSLHISNLAVDTITIGLLNTTSGSLGELTTTPGAATLSIKDLDITASSATLSAASDGSATNGAQDAILAIDAALDQISNSRAAFGATQNRLNFTIDNLTVTGQNTSASRSRIEDADMAAESSNMTKTKILMQSSIAMLTQANQSPQMILQLLQQQ